MDFGQFPDGTFTCPTEIGILPPIFQQGQLWYKSNESDQTLLVI
jgi:hypothetical protein